MVVHMWPRTSSVFFCPIFITLYFPPLILVRFDLILCFYTIDRIVSTAVVFSSSPALLSFVSSLVAILYGRH